MPRPPNISDELRRRIRDHADLDGITVYDWLDRATTVAWIDDESRRLMIRLFDSPDVKEIVLRMLAEIVGEDDASA